MAGGGLRVVIDRSIVTVALGAHEFGRVIIKIRHVPFRQSDALRVVAIGNRQPAIGNRQSAIGNRRLQVGGWRLKSEVGQSSVSSKKVYNSECYDPLARVNL